MENRFYDIISKDYYTSGEVTVDPDCNGWTAINNGDQLVRVNGIPLKPFPAGHPELTGAAVAIPGNLGELYKGRIWIAFDDSLGGTNPWVSIIQKFYKKA